MEVRHDVLPLVPGEHLAGVRKLIKRRRPSFDAEQLLADQWGEQLAASVLLKLFPADEIRALLGRYKDLAGPPP